MGYVYTIERNDGGMQMVEVTWSVRFHSYTLRTAVRMFSCIALLTTEGGCITPVQPPKPSTSVLAVSLTFKLPFESSVCPSTDHPVFASIQMTDKAVPWPDDETPGGSSTPMEAAMLGHHGKHPGAKKKGRVAPYGLRNGMPPGKANGEPINLPGSPGYKAPLVLRSIDAIAATQRDFFRARLTLTAAAALLDQGARRASNGMMDCSVTILLGLHPAQPLTNALIPAECLNLANPSCDVELDPIAWRPDNQDGLIDGLTKLGKASRLLTAAEQEYQATLPANSKTVVLSR